MPDNQKKINIEKAAQNVETVAEGIDLIIDWLTDERKDFIKDLTPYGLSNSGYSGLHFGLNLTVRNFFMRKGNPAFKKDYSNFINKYSGFSRGEIGEGCFVDAIWRKLKGISISSRERKEIERIQLEIERIPEFKNDKDDLYLENRVKKTKLYIKQKGIVTGFNEDEILNLCDIAEKEILLEKVIDKELFKKEYREIKIERDCVMARFSEKEKSLFMNLLDNRKEVIEKLKIEPDNEALTNAKRNLLDKRMSMLLFASRTRKWR